MKIKISEITICVIAILISVPWTVRAQEELDESISGADVILLSEEDEEDEEERHHAENPPRFFFHMGYSIGFVGVRPGMLADSTIPYDPRLKPDGWSSAINGQYAPPGYSEGEWLNVINELYSSYVLSANGTAPTGNDTRTLDPGCDVDPDQYCVRVNHRGVRPTAGLHFELGYWFTKRFGASMDFRLQAHAGRDRMARTMVSFRAHALLTKPNVRGFHVSLFTGLGVGQIQGRVSQGTYQGEDLSRESTMLVYLPNGTPLHEPWVVVGHGQAQAGITIGYRFTPTFSAILQRTYYVFFPRFTYASDNVLGVEASF